MYEIHTINLLAFSLSVRMQNIIQKVPCKVRVCLMQNWDHSSSWDYKMEWCDNDMKAYTLDIMNYVFDAKWCNLVLETMINTNINET